MAIHRDCFLLSFINASCRFFSISNFKSVASLLFVFATKISLLLFAFKMLFTLAVDVAVLQLVLWLLVLLEDVVLVLLLLLTLVGTRGWKQGFLAGADTFWFCVKGVLLLDCCVAVNGSNLFARSFSLACRCFLRISSGVHRIGESPEPEMHNI